MPGLLPTGWDPKRLEDIETEIKNSLWTNISPSLNLSSVSLLGQFVGTLSSQIAQLWEAAQDIYTGMDPDQAVGDALTSISKITGTVREAAAPSTAFCALALSAGTYAPNTLIVYKTGEPESRFTNLSPVVTPGGTTFATLTATQDGPITALAGTLVNIATAVAGFTSVSNVTDAVVGRNGETDSELRLRRDQGLAKAGSGTVDAIRADLLGIAAVSQVSVLENDSDTTNIYGVPGHGIMALVVGGVDQDIRDQIWASKSPQTATGGSTTGTVVDAQGNSHTVNFQRPSAIPIYVAVTISVLNGFQGDITSKAKAAITSVVTGRVGWDVIYNKCVGAVIALEGVVDVTLAKVDDVFPPVASANVVINFNEYASIVDANITVTVNVVSDYP